MNTAQRALKSIRHHADRSSRTLRSADVSIAGPFPFFWLGAAVVAGLVLALPRATRGWLRGRKVQDVMTTSVTSIDASSSLMDAAEMMRQANIGVLPVVGSDGKVQGVITDRDLVVRAMARGADARTTHVGECQTRHVVCARPEWSLAEAMERMAECQVGRLPVVDDGDRLLGIVTLGSLALRSGQEERTLETAKEVSRR